MPLYVVEDSRTGEKRLVNAGKPSTARAHVVGDRFKISAPDMMDVHALGKAGVEIETAGEEQTEPEPQTVPETAQSVTADMPSGWSLQAVGEGDTPGPKADHDPDADELRSYDDPPQRRSIIDELDDDNDGRLTDEQFRGQQD